MAQGQRIDESRRTSPAHVGEEPLRRFACMGRLQRCTFFTVAPIARDDYRQ